MMPAGLAQAEVQQPGASLVRIELGELCRGTVATYSIAAFNGRLYSGITLNPTIIGATYFAAVYADIA